MAYLERLWDILNIFDPDKYNEIMSCNAILLKWPRIKLHHRSIEGVVVEWFPYQKGVSVRYE